MISTIPAGLRRVVVVCCVLGCAGSLGWGGPSATAARNERLEAAERLYQAKYYIQAATAFQELVESGPDRDTQVFCLMRLGDCWWVGDWWPPQATRDNLDFSPDQYYALAMEFGYTSHLAEAFFKWRTAHQAFWHGVSNFSAIPQALYESRRQGILVIVSEHLRMHPGDRVALEQQAWLEAVPGITRGNLMGSSMLTDLAIGWPEHIPGSSQSILEERTIR